MKLGFKYLKTDLLSGIVVFLVALPLCLGIALASGAPLFAGIISGIVGGIVVGFFSGSSLSVSGPAAGLTVIVASAIAKVPVYEAFLLSVIIAGVVQIGLGKLKAGVIGDFVPSSVIKGMLAAIGLILIMKQFPHLIGYDADFEGDESFAQLDSENTFSEIIRSVQYISPAAVIIGAVALFIQMLWETKTIKKIKFLSQIPAALIVVFSGVGIHYLIGIQNPELILKSKQLVDIPVADSFSSFASQFTFPQLGYLNNINVWISGITIAIVASLESLLSLEATDKLDPYNRVSPPNKELVAQGIGNVLAGFLGGLPVTAVIVRSSANINSGAQSKLSAIFHGFLLLLAVYFIPALLNLIPLSALAGVLIFVGYKLAKPSLFAEQYKKGLDQFIPFVITILAILFTDLLIGIMVGIMVGLFFVIRSNFKTAVMFVHDAESYLVRFRKEVSFLNKPLVKRKLEEIPSGSYVLIDGTRSEMIDRDIIEVVNEFAKHAPLKKIKVEFKSSPVEDRNYFTNN